MKRACGPVLILRTCGTYWPAFGGARWDITPSASHCQYSLFRPIVAGQDYRGSTPRMTCGLLLSLDCASGKCQSQHKEPMNHLVDGWYPLPFREFIVKIHSRCDLSCDYCYMSEMANQSWREQLRVASDEVAELIARGIGEQARPHDLDQLTLVLHGGEPLLAGWDLIV
jgi:sulfatase maturation enzyme AslB (radical SAM superfamily)